MVMPFDLFGILCHLQHCTGHITKGSFVGRANQYIQLVKVLYCKLPTIGKQLPTFPHKVQGLNLSAWSCHPVIRVKIKQQYLGAITMW